jgi:hypothetical protein
MCRNSSAHEALAETHDLVVGFALGIEIRSALAAAHGQGGEGVLEDLFEGQELENADIDRRMEAQTALVGTDGAVHLDPKAPVHVDLAPVVHPGYPEQDRPFGLHDPLQHRRFAVFRVSIQHRPDGFHHLLHRLVELPLAGIPGRDYVEDVAHRIRSFPNGQLSVVGYQLSVVGCQWTVVGCRWPEEYGRMRYAPTKFRPNERHRDLTGSGRGRCQWTFLPGADH